MPATATKTVTTAELRKGDVVVSGPTRTLSTGIVEVTSLRAKRATVEFKSGVRGDCDRTATFIVEREELTDEEKAAERDEYLEKSLRRRRASVAANLASIRDKMATALANNQMASHWDFTALAEAQATEELWARVDLMEQRQSDRLHAGEVEPTDEIKSYLEIVETVRERCREDLLSFRAESRSTSTMSNAVEDQIQAAKREFISRWI